MNTYRTTARIVGSVYVAGLVIGIGGMVLIQSILGAPDHLSAVSASSTLLAIGAVLWLMAVAWDAAHGILMFSRVWLIVKGFNASAFASESDNPDDGVLTGVRQPTVVPSNR